jgi:Zn-dependent peptidase ImmA (M78 family)
MGDTEALVSANIVDWAIKRVNENLTSLSSKLDVTPENIHAWRTGNAKPNFPQAIELAKKLKIPFGYLFLDSPPQEKFPLPDLRTLTGFRYQKPSPNFLEVLYDALRKQDWYREHLIDEGATPLPYIRKYSSSSDPHVIASDIRGILGIDHTLRQDCVNWEDFLKNLVYRAEQKGIIVLRTGIVADNTHRKLDIQEFRGFAISDDIAPLIFINENDYRTAQIFTIAHELTHLWIGASGISNLNYSLRSSQQTHAVDRFCDKVAAEILIPGEDFIIRWDGFATLDNNLNKLSRYYKVSTFVVLRRAYEFDLISDESFQNKYEELITKIKRKKPSGGDYYRLVLSRNSASFTKTLVVASSEGHVLPTVTARLLNIKISKLNSVENYVMFGESTRV